MIEAGNLLGDQSPVQLVFIGDGPEKISLKKKVQQEGHGRVVFLDPVSKAEMPGVLTASDLAIVPLKMDLPGAVPSKIYEAMAASLPLILIAEGEPAEIVRKYQCGLVVKPGDIQGIAEALRQLADNVELRQKLGDAGRRAAETFYDRQLIIDRFAEYLDQATLSKTT